MVQHSQNARSNSGPNQRQDTRTRSTRNRSYSKPAAMPRAIAPSKALA